MRMRVDGMNDGLGVTQRMWCCGGTANQLWGKRHSPETDEMEREYILNVRLK